VSWCGSCKDALKSSAQGVSLCVCRLFGGSIRIDSGDGREGRRKIGQRRVLPSGR